MLERAEAWARDARRARLTLWVAASNEAARHLYEKTGFTIARSRRSLLTRLFFGIAQWHFMEKRLAEPPA